MLIERQANSKNVACNNIASSCLALFLKCLRKRHVDNKCKIDTTFLVLNRPTKPSDKLRDRVGYSRQGLALCGRVGYTKKVRLGRVN